MPAPGFGQVDHAHGPPTDPVVLGLADADDLLWLFLRHVGHQRAVVAAEHRGLDPPDAEQRLAGVPMVAAIVADRHDADGEGIAVQRQQDPSAEPWACSGAAIPIADKAC